MNSEFAGRHTCDSPEWYTPHAFVESARKVMGGIDLDPASHEEANRIVQASEFFTKEQNGLRLRWHGRVFLNPPGGSVNEFWRKLMDEAFHYEQSIWIGYSLEQLQTIQQSSAKLTPLDFPTCFTAKRIAFIENAAKKDQRIAKQIAAGKKPSQGNSLSHSNYITYIGSNVEAFVREFSQYGKVRL